MELLYKIMRLFKQSPGHGLDVKATLGSITAEDYEFGDGQLEAKFGASVAVIKSDGQWDADLPKIEYQSFPWGETFHCTVFGTENCIQVLMKAKYGKIEEYTERYLGVLAKIKNGVGGSPNEVAEQWRKRGNLLYDKLPFEGVTSWSQFNSPNPMTADLVTEGEKWLTKWTFGHDWIWDFRPEVLMEALKYSPLGVGVYTWQKVGDKYTKPSWATDNHWVMIYGYVKGDHWKVYDHYDSVHKKLAWDYPFSFAKRFTLSMKTTDEQALQEDGKKLYEQLKKKHIIVVPSGEVYEVRDGYELYYEFWGTSSAWFQGILDSGLRAKEKSGEFIGITEENFTKLKAACVLAGGGVRTDEKTIERLKGLLESLTK